MDPAVVVGLDFGTTYSGFAFAHRNDPSDVHILENWPSSDIASGKTYCKTQTSLFYTRAGRSLELEAQAWGWPALLAFMDAIHEQGSGYGSANSGGQKDLEQAITILGQNKAVFATKFKLMLAPDAEEQYLPDGLSVQRLISDYLKFMSEFIVDHLKDKYGKHFKKRDVQWCITVPAIWDDGAKQQMQICCEIAGMVQGKFCTDSSAKIKEEFCDEVEHIIVPVNPGAAVLHGAVRFGFRSNLVLSRISKRTYGMSITHKFRGCHSIERVYTDEYGVQRCDNIFEKFVQKNQSVLLDSCVKHSSSPIYADQKEMDLSLYSSDVECPVHTTDAGCVMESNYTMDISQDLHLGNTREIEVKMYFGRSTIEVSARRVNFGNPKPEKLYFVKFETA